MVRHPVVSDIWDSHDSLLSQTLGYSLLPGHISVFVLGRLRVPRLYVWDPGKLPLLAISRSGVMQGFEIVIWFSFVLECTMSIFKVLNMLPRFSFLFENTKNIPLIDGELCTQCVLPRHFTSDTVIVFVRKNSLEKCVTRWSIFSHMQYF